MSGALREMARRTTGLRRELAVARGELAALRKELRAAQNAVEVAEESAADAEYTIDREVEAAHSATAGWVDAVVVLHEQAHEARWPVRLCKHTPCRDIDWLAVSV